MPLTPDRTCPRPVDMSGYTGGQVPGFCDDPQHNSDRAYRARQRFDRQAQATTKEPVPRPVTQGINSLAVIVRRLEDVKNEITGLLDAVTDATGAISDPASVSYEVDRVRRESEVRIAEVEKACAAFEHAAAVAGTDRDRAVAMRDTAVAATEEALQERDAALRQATHAIEEAKRAVAVTEARTRKEIDGAHSATAVAEHQRDAAVAEAHRVRAQLDQLLADQARELRELRKTSR